MKPYAMNTRVIACVAVAVALFAAPSQAQVVINELHYHPEAPNGDAEFIELHNSGAAPVDISGWTLSGFAANTFAFPASTSIAAGGYVVVANDAALLESITTPSFLTPYQWATGNLSNGGETVTLSDDLSVVVDSVSYKDAPPWPAAPDGDGPSLELVNPGFDNTSPLVWGASTVGNGTPGAQNSTFSNSPLVLSESPARLSVVETLATASVTFTEPVQNLSADDLSVNGSFATSVSGSGAGPYDFSGFAAPATAPITVDLAAGAIEDLDSNAFGGASWFHANVVINEIHYHPTDPNGDAEFLELLNAGTIPADISGWLLEFGPLPFQFPPATTLAPGGVTVVAMDPTLLQTLTGYLAPHQWPAGALSNGGELVTLSVSLGVETDRVDFGDQNSPPWPAKPDGDGPSLELLHPSLDNTLPLAWKASTGANGTPGNTNSAFDAGPIVIVESPARGSFIGAGLTELSVTFHEEVTGVVAGDLIVDGAAASSVSGIGAGPYVFSVPAPTSDQVAVSIGPGAIQDLALNPFSGDSWQYVLALPDVVINEIHYHPSAAAVGAGEDPERLQFLELYNNGTSSADLTGWRLTDGVSFDFPAGSSIAAGAYILVAGDGTFLSSTVATIPGGTQIFDWVAGDLDNGGEVVRLTDPFANTIDRVEYNDEGIWPVSPDGTGPSLELIHPNLLNQFELSWEASTGTNGTPGELNSIFNINPAPVIADVVHDPPIPAGGVPITITARAFDASPFPISTLQVCHRQDQSPTLGYTCTAMLDDGLSGDGAAGDGLYGVSLAGLADGQRMDFAIAASAGGGLTLAPRGHDCGLNPGSADCTAANPSKVYLVKFSDAGVPTDFPSYHLITTQVTRNAQATHDKTEYDGTIVHCQTDGSCEIHYNVVERYRGRGSLTRHPHSYNIRFPDNPVQSELGFELRTLLLLGINPHRQELGHGLFERAGHPAPLRQFARIVRDPQPHEGLENWLYLNIERVDEDFMSSQDGAVTPTRYPDRCSDSNTVCTTNLDCPGGETCDNTDQGNIYRGRGTADLRYLGPAVGPPPCDGPYRLPCGSELGGYQKVSNVDEDQWTDLINLTDALTCSTSDGGSICVENNYNGVYESNLPDYMDVQPFAAWFALHNLIVNTEGGIYRDTGDDYYVSFQTNLDHARMITWDMDAITGSNTNETIWRTRADAPERVIERNAIAGYFVGEICRLLNAEFSVTEMHATIDALPEALFTQPQSSENQGNGPRTRQGMKDWVVNRHSGVLNQISTQTTLTGVPASPYNDPDPVIQLSGSLNQCGARRVLVNGIEADQYQIFTESASATWSSSFTLQPGVNNIVVQTVDHEGIVIDSASDVVIYGLCVDNEDCNDAAFCNGVETCDIPSGLCVAGTPPDCTDAVTCTVDTCNEGTGSCDNSPDDGLCDDSNVCTDDICNIASGCQSVDNTATCEDGDLCSGPDFCAAGFCTSGGAVDCDDLIFCTDDSCDSGTGCQNVDNCPSGDTCNLGLDICETVPAAAALPIILGDSWSYFKGQAEPTTPIGDLAWAQVGFDDSAWLSGPSGFGYGDISAPNTLLPDMQNSYFSVYFRREFNIVNPAQVDSLVLTLDYDDAFVAFINGVEVVRTAGLLADGDGTPQGVPTTFNQLANFPTGTSPGGDQNHESGTAEAFDIGLGTTTPAPPAGVTSGTLVVYSGTLDGLLQAGNNVIAIHGHNVSTGSSDFVIKPTLSATFGAGCNVDADCDDDKICTDDTCNTGTGECIFTPNANACDDGEACTADICSGGLCVSTPDDGNSCTDGVDCTADACSSGSCISSDNCTGGDVCNVSTGVCETPLSLQAGDVIISGFQPSNPPLTDEWVELFNTSSTPIALDSLELIVRIDTNGDGNPTVDWQLPAGLLNGASIAPHGFFLLREGTGPPAGDWTGDLDLTTDEGGSRGISIELVIAGAHMDYLVYGLHTAEPGGAADVPPGDLSFDGLTFPRTEVVRSCAPLNAGQCSASPANYSEGAVIRATDVQLHAGHDVEGYYTDETALGSGFPDGVWNSDHTLPPVTDPRNSTSATVPPPGGTTCTLDSECDNNGACDGIETCNLSTSLCQAGSALVCDDGDACTDDSCDPIAGCQTTDNSAPCDDLDACTINDVCSGGVCSGPPLDCDDGSACTNDSCVAGSCVYSPNGVCNIEGDVFYYRDNTSGGFEPSTKGVPNVDIDIDQDSVADATSTLSGSYVLSVGRSTVVVETLEKFGASEVSDHNGAVSSFDATFIARHAVAMGTPLSTNQIVAGDVSGNGQITSFDAALVAQYTVGLLPGGHFPVAVNHQSDWAFFRCDNYAGASTQDCGPPLYAHDPFTAPEVDDDFHAVLYGDVTGNWQPAAAPPAPGRVDPGSGSVADPTDPEALAWSRDQALNTQLGGVDSASRLALLQQMPGGELRPDLYLELVPTTSQVIDGVRRQTYQLVMRQGDGLQALDLELSLMGF